MLVIERIMVSTGSLFVAELVIVDSATDVRIAVDETLELDGVSDGRNRRGVRVRTELSSVLLL